MNVSTRMNELGIELSDAPTPVGAYVSYVISQSLMFISGQIPLKDGKLLYMGKVSHVIDVAQAQECARVCFLNAMAQAKAALGDLEHVERIVRISGYVASSEGFTDQALVLNGASNLAIDIFGEKGRHARTAVGVAELPLGAPVELEVILEISRLFARSD